MNIQDITIKPYEDCFLPGLKFEVKINRQKFQYAINEVYGQLRTDNGKILAPLNEIMEQGIKREELGVRGSYYDSQFKNELFSIKLYSLLNKEAINYIEKRRFENKQKDVILKFSIIISFVESKSRIFAIYPLPPRKLNIEPFYVETSQGEKDGKILTYAYDSQLVIGPNNLGLICPDNRSIAFSFYKQLMNWEIRISSSDWVNNFIQKLGLNEYFIVEIPKGSKIIKNAWDYAEKAENRFRKWDYDGVASNCREAGTLLDNTLKEKFGKKSFIFNERWKRAFRNFKDLTSLGLHLEDLKNSQKYDLDKVFFGRIDSEYILNLTKLLIKFAEELLLEKE